jgi:replicative DNA helicase
MGVLTGIQDLDRALGGLQKSDLVVLAGRPSMGKTALATSMGKGAAEKDQAGEGGSKIGFFSLEMSAEQLANGSIAMDTGMAVERQRSGHLSQSRDRAHGSRGPGNRCLTVLDRRRRAS